MPTPNAQPEEELLQTYYLLKSMEHTADFQREVDRLGFQTLYPLLDQWAAQQSGPLTPEALRAAARTDETLSEALTATHYDMLGNSPATYFICGVWANMKRGREFHPASHAITVTYEPPDAYGNQNVNYRNRDCAMTLIFEAVEEYTRNLSWTAHRLLLYTLMRGNAQNWRHGAAVFNIADYMDWAGLGSRDAAYRQIKKDLLSLTRMQLTAESFKKYFESFYTTHLATEASIKKYTGDIRITFSDSVRRCLTQFYQLVPDWMGKLGENAYWMAFYLFYRARKAPLGEDRTFRVRVEDIVMYIGLPGKEDVKNRNYDAAIMRPFHRAVEEILERSCGALSLTYTYDNINTFLAAQMTVQVDETLASYVRHVQTLEEHTAAALAEQANHRHPRTPSDSGKKDGSA